MQKLNFLRNIYKTVRYQKCMSVQYRNYSLVQQLPHFLKHGIKIRWDRAQVNFVCTSRTDVTKCWNCGVKRKQITDLLCDKCNVLQQPHNTENYFKVLDVNEDFEVDQKLLTRKYRNLQTVLHPDKFGNKSDTEKTISADYSALVNKAYNTLQTPLRRAIHMLHLHGEQVEEDQKVTDPEFLMEIMDLNEEVEGAKTPDQLKKLNEQNKYALEEIGHEICKHFRENHIEKAKAGVIRMKYYNSVSLHINGLLRERGIVD